MGNSKGLLMDFDRMFEEFDRILSGGYPAYEFYQNTGLPCDIWVNPNTGDLEFEFAVAGYGSENISVTFQDDHMLLEAQKPESKEEKEGFHRVQRGIKTTNVKRRFYLPSSKFDLEKAEAQMDNGLLRIKLPAREDSRPVQLQIQGK